MGFCFCFPFLTEKWKIRKLLCFQFCKCRCIRRAKSAALLVWASSKWAKFFSCCMLSFWAAEHFEFWSVSQTLPLAFLSVNCQWMNDLHLAFQKLKIHFRILGSLTLWMSHISWLFVNAQILNQSQFGTDFWNWVCFHKWLTFSLSLCFSTIVTGWHINDGCHPFPLSELTKLGLCNQAPFVITSEPTTMKRLCCNFWHQWWSLHHFLLHLFLEFWQRILRVQFFILPSQDCQQQNVIKLLLLRFPICFFSLCRTKLWTESFQCLKKILFSAKWSLNNFTTKLKSAKTSTNLLWTSKLPQDEHLTWPVSVLRVHPSIRHCGMSAPRCTFGSSTELSFNLKDFSTYERIKHLQSRIWCCAF